MDAEANFCRENDDPRPDWNPQLTDHDFAPEEVVYTKKCSGYGDDQCKRKCDKGCDSIIHFRDLDDKDFYFCAAIHFLRFYCKHYADRPKTKSGGKGGKSSKKQKLIKKEMILIQLKVNHKVT
eukprot:TRINITY_DN2868_c0_g1_i1.p1 TRINITY_DN2868_c0_g1~~TRINITY_DN2868_c0_g1_i1.p1  ORF type:complete len:123 (-),score=24.68 TRINITY_DN2868_c0_g1_i1:38-406(-)